MQGWLYDGVGQDWLSLDAVREHVAQWLPALDLEPRPDLLAWGLNSAPDGRGELCKRLAERRVIDPTRPHEPRKLLGPEAEYEARVVRGETRATAGVVYEGGELQRIAWELLPPDERRITAVHVWLTERQLATWDEDDRRYHLRVGFYGYPAIISTTGLVHAPARDRSHYLARGLGIRGGAAEDAADYLTPGDPRTTNVVKGHVMQAIVYLLTGEAFCDDPHCRLVDAHRQRDLLVAQTGGTDYCPRHRELLADLSARLSAGEA